MQLHNVKQKKDGGGLCVHALLCFSVSQPGKQKRKFSSFFKSLVIELDKELYGPDNHLVEVRQTENFGHRQRFLFFFVIETQRCNAAAVFQK